MKCNRTEQLILLKDSGELGAWGRWRLNRHLAGCTACRAYEASLHMVKAAARAWPTGELSERTLTAIRAAGAVDRREAIVLSPPARPAWGSVFVYATAALVLLGGVLWLALPHQTPLPAVVRVEQPAPPEAAATAWSDDFDSELDALNSQFASVLDDSNGGTATQKTQEDDEDTIARELLTLQGYQI